MNHPHKIKQMYENSFMCIKCYQYCYSSIEYFLSCLDPNPNDNDTGCCVAINDHDMVLVGLKTGNIISEYTCTISDEDYLIEEIIK